jgi:hypothetical protein
MFKQYHKYFLLVAGIWLTILSSCCDPAQRNSFPTVIDSSYADTAVKDAIDLEFPIEPLDSGFYPVYSLDIKNTGSEADTFTLSISRVRNGIEIPLITKEYVQAGETKTFKTYGPLPPNSPDSAKANLYSFFVMSPDSVSIFTLKPQVSIHYGQTPNGAEQCGTRGNDISVDISKLTRK